MKINAVSVTSKNMKDSVEFYKILGFEFSEFKENEQHIEPKTPDGSARLMIDTDKLVQEITNEEPKPGNHAGFAILYDSVDEVNEVAARIKSAGFTVIKEPWDAFWGQRYAIVEDPDGYRMDLYAYLNDAKAD